MELKGLVLEQEIHLMSEEDKKKTVCGSKSGVVFNLKHALDRDDLGRCDACFDNISESRSEVVRAVACLEAPNLVVGIPLS